MNSEEMAEHSNVVEFPTDCTRIPDLLSVVELIRLIIDQPVTSSPHSPEFPGHGALGPGPPRRPTGHMNPDFDPLQPTAAFREVAAALISKIREDPGVILARIPPERIVLRRLVHDLASGAREEELEILFGLAARVCDKNSIVQPSGKIRTVCLRY